jgi:D-inositol-3-phosphate glycosyltransferase
VDGHDPADYAAAVRRLIVDKPLAASLAAGAVQYATGFSWDRTAGELLAVYAEARHAPSYAVPVVG